MDGPTKYQLSRMLQWALRGAGLGAAGVLAIKSLAELKDLERKNKLDAELETMARPAQEITLSKSDLEQLDKENKKLAAIKAAGISPVIGEALKWLGGAAGVGAGTYGANKIFNYLKRDELKKELKDAEAQYYTTLYLRKKLEEELANKKTEGSMFRFASEELEDTIKIAGIKEVAGGGLALILALALGSALLSRNYWEAKNPQLNQLDVYKGNMTAPELRSPKLRFNITDTPNPEKTTLNDIIKADEANEDINIAKKQMKEAEKEAIKERVAETGAEGVKLASAGVCKMLLPQAKECILKLAAELEKENITNGGINAVIDTVALGEIDLLKTAKSLDELCDKALDYVSSTRKIASEVNKALAVSYIVNDKILGDVFVPYAAADLLDQVPAFNKLASVVTAEDAEETFTTLLGLYNLEQKSEVFKDIELCKTASEDDLVKFVTEYPIEHFDNDMHAAIEQALKHQIFN